MVGLTVLLAGVVTVAVTGLGPRTSAPQVALEASADAETGRVTLEHVSGPPLDIRRLTLRVEVDGEPLAHQAPVPF